VLELVFLFFSVLCIYLCLCCEFSCQYQRTRLPGKTMISSVSRGPVNNILCPLFIILGEGAASPLHGRTLRCIELFSVSVATHWSIKYGTVARQLLLLLRRLLLNGCWSMRTVSRRPQH